MSEPILMTREEWRPVHGYVGRYAVSDHGRLWSLLSQQLLTPRINRHGYEEVKLRRHGDRRNSGGKNHRVHVLVLEAFVGPRPEPEQEGRHGNGRRTANGLHNLSWGSPTENILDAVRHGTWANTAKTTCPLDHSLVEPNLIVSKLREGRRKCLACRRAQDEARREVARGVVIDVRAAADRHYAVIMKEAAA